MAAKILDLMPNEEESRLRTSSSSKMLASAAVMDLDRVRKITAQPGFPSSLDGASRTYLSQRASSMPDM